MIRFILVSLLSFVAVYFLFGLFVFGFLVLLGVPLSVEAASEIVLNWPRWVGVLIFVLKL